MAKKNEKTGNKTVCPVSREQFKKATPLKVVITQGDAVVATLLASPKEFATGSFGFFANEKLIVEVGGIPMKVQSNLLMTAVGSKDLPK